MTEYNNVKFSYKHNDKVDALTTDVELVEQTTDVTAYAGQHTITPPQYSWYDGQKYSFGMNQPQLQFVDYYTLRLRSSELFNQNLYAKGIINRLVTNEITSGLSIEAKPEYRFLNISREDSSKWSEEVERKFSLWASSPQMCDYLGKSNFAEIQKTARREALIEGDVLVILKYNPRTKTPTIQLVSGSMIKSPIVEILNKNINQGVELDDAGRHVAYYIHKDDSLTDYERIPAYGKKGRLVSWLMYGSEGRLDEVRGQPLISVIMQSLDSIDKYRDSAQLKAKLGANIVGFIKKTQEGIGTLPLTGGKRNNPQRMDQSQPQRKPIASVQPGQFFEELAHGEEPVLLGGNGTDINFSGFESTIINAIAWALQIPPEILTLSFNSNYSASQAALNEFKIYLNNFWESFGSSFCAPIYRDWLAMEVINGRIKASGFNPYSRNSYEFQAWTKSVWYGNIKPSTDPLKQVKASISLIDAGLSTYDRESRVLTGTKFSDNIESNQRNNLLIAKAREPLLKQEQEFAQAPQAVAQEYSAEDVYLMEWLNKDE